MSCRQDWSRLKCFSSFSRSPGLKSPPGRRMRRLATQWVGQASVRHPATSRLGDMCHEVRWDITYGTVANATHRCSSGLALSSIMQRSRTHVPSLRHHISHSISLNPSSSKGDQISPSYKVLRAWVGSLEHVWPEVTQTNPPWHLNTKERWQAGA